MPTNWGVSFWLLEGLTRLCSQCLEQHIKHETKQLRATDPLRANRVFHVCVFMLQVQYFWSFDGFGCLRQLRCCFHLVNVLCGHKQSLVKREVTLLSLRFSCWPLLEMGPLSWQPNQYRGSWQRLTNFVVKKTKKLCRKIQFCWYEAILNKKHITMWSLHH